MKILLCVVCKTPINEDGCVCPKVKLGHCLVCKKPNVKGNKKCKCVRDYCSWCGIYNWLEPGGFCSMCAEDPERIETASRNLRVDRIASRRKKLEGE